MMWLTWRQFRAQAITGAAALAVVAIALGVTGLQLSHLFASNGLATCQAHGDCAALVNAFMNQMQATPADSLLFHASTVLLWVAPALIGVFWGAPLVAREIEAGTFRLVWNQSVTRARWLAVKLGLVGLACMATAGLLSLMVTWWSSPIDIANALPDGRNGVAPGLDRFAPGLFGVRGITPIGYAAFAFALGVTAGVLIRRTVPAMAVTLAVFAAVQVAMPLWIRPHLMPPRHATAAINSGSFIGWSSTSDGTIMNVIAKVDLPGAWVITNQALTPAGRLFSGPAPTACTSPTAPAIACPDALGRLHLRQLVTYQPAGRYWAFQWYETGIFLVLAGGLGGCCAWLIRRRAP